MLFIFMCKYFGVLATLPFKLFIIIYYLISI